MKTLIIAAIVVVFLGFGAYFLFPYSTSTTALDTEPEAQDPVTGVMDENQNEGAEPADDTRTVIGQSVDRSEITAYHYGTGENEVLFVGGIHGGYSWNTVLVAYELMDYLEDNPAAVPENVRVTVVPVLNPDGLETVVGTTSRFARADVPSAEAETIPGRFNANDVDLNRNFACDWQREGAWQNRTVSGGTAEFSEPESRAIRDYVESSNPRAVVVWYSAAGGVFASNCHNGVLPETSEITQIYADASGYRAYREFNFYEITGDMVNWLAREGVPAISVLLTTHNDVEWDKNRAGIDALLEHYAQ